MDSTGDPSRGTSSVQNLKALPRWFANASEPAVRKLSNIIMKERIGFMTQRKGSRLLCIYSSGIVYISDLSVAKSYIALWT